MKFGDEDRKRVLSLILFCFDFFGYLRPIVRRSIIVAVAEVPFSIWSCQIAKMSLPIAGQASNLLNLIDGPHLFLLKLIGQDDNDFLYFILDKGKG
jgi:hypothetical protein